MSTTIISLNHGVDNNLLPSSKSPTSPLMTPKCRNFGYDINLDDIDVF